MTATITDIVQKYQGVASSHVINAVKTASKRAGVDFSFMMEKAATESNFNPKARARTSSASGLYQFIEGTWLSMVKQHGAKYGLAKHADKISIDDNGRATVADKTARKQILALRNDPQVASYMAAEFCAQNKEYLEDRTQCDVGSTELYLAHFMGAGGAAKFLNSRTINGQAIAADLFPQAARANKNVFYDRASGKARTLDQVYAFFDKKFDDNSSPRGYTVSPSSTAVTSSPLDAAVTVPARAPVTTASPANNIGTADVVAQALPLFDDGYDADDIIWNDDPRFFPRTATAENAAQGFQKLSPATLLAVIEIQNTAVKNAAEKEPNHHTGRPQSVWYNA